MKKLSLLLLLLSVWVFFCSCDGFDELEEDNNQQFEVTVVDAAHCNFILLQFRLEDAVALKRITGQEGTLYYGLQLSKILVHPGQRLLIEIRKTNEQDEYVCPTFVPTHPTLTILSLRILE